MTYEEEQKQRAELAKAGAEKLQKIADLLNMDTELSENGNHAKLTDKTGNQFRPKISAYWAAWNNSTHYELRAECNGRLLAVANISTTKPADKIAREITTRLIDACAEQIRKLVKEAAERTTAEARERETITQLFEIYGETPATATFSCSKNYKYQTKNRNLSLEIYGDRIYFAAECSKEAAILCLKILGAENALQNNQKL